MPSDFFRNFNYNDITHGISMKSLFLSLLLLLGCGFATAAAPNPREVAFTAIQQKMRSLPPRGRLFVDFAAWTPDKAKESFAFEPGRIMTMKNADYIMTLPPVQYELEGKRLLTVSRAVLDRTLNLAFAWKFTGDEKYARRAVKEVVNAAAFPDWNPKHFLDTSTMAMGLAVGYDYLYDFLTENERRLLVDAMAEKGLKPAEAVKKGWPLGTNNWTQVCYGGLAAAALVCADAYPELSARLIHRAVVNTPEVMELSYSPNGGYPEGPSYWDYGTSYNCFLIALLKHALGTDFGLSEVPGWSTTGVFFSHGLTPAGNTYHYADGMNECVPTFANFYLDHQYPGSSFFCPKSRSRLEWYSRQKPKNGRLVPAKFIQFSMFFMDKNTGNAPPPARAYWSGKGATLPIFMCRTAWTPDALYLGIKGGGARLSHAHMDAGSFVIESEGVYFVQELGNERYINIEKLGLDLWSPHQESDRWKLLRYGVRGHSVIRIDDDPQLVTGFATLENVRTAPDGTCSLDVELSTLYANAGSVTRSVDFNAKRIRFADKLTGLKPGAKVIFQFCTRTGISNRAPGTILLSSKGKFMRVTAKLPGNAPVRWQHIPADQLRKEYEARNGNAEIVWFETVAPASGEVTYSVEFLPGKK